MQNIWCEIHSFRGLYKSFYIYEFKIWRYRINQGINRGVDTGIKKWLRKYLILKVFQLKQIELCRAHISISSYMCALLSLIYGNVCNANRAKRYMADLISKLPYRPRDRILYPVVCCSFINTCIYFRIARVTKFLTNTRIQYAYIQYNSTIMRSQMWLLNIDRHSAVMWS